MLKKNAFNIYNASAGSGKTYTLVKSYLAIVLGAKTPDVFKRILAITFTNKAVAEMKSRIVDTLRLFSNKTILTAPDSMFEELCAMLNLEPETLHSKSKTALHTIIHNYAAFDVSTIDGFTHRIIRTFAHDLKLPLNFEVELDQEALLSEAVDRVIYQAGTDKILTKNLVDFALEKADDDKSWDITQDLNKIAKLLVNESDLEYLDALKDKTSEDFKALKQQLAKAIKDAENAIKTHANTVLTTIENAGLAFTDFTRGTLPNHFKKASALELNGLYKNKLEENIVERKGIYAKSLALELADRIEQLLPEFEVLYKLVKAEVFHLKFLKAFYKNITPLSVLNAINRALILHKASQNKMLISEFNTIISNEIKNQPTPFIYERIGEKFKHYFIDEFQDTSVKQWENLIPLLANALSVEQGSTLLVGDAKQAIYRWRGGKAEQFIKLFNLGSSPFSTQQNVVTLEANYRSSKAIVNFNNGFFEYLSKTVFQEEDYANLYEKASQETKKTKDGYVELNFLDIGRDDDRDEAFCEATLKTIQTVINDGYRLSDITILVRKKKEGVALASYLSERGIAIVSSETLLIMNAPEVQFINNVLKYLIQPENNEVKIEILEFLAKRYNIDEKHDFFEKHINSNSEDFFKQFELLGIYISPKNILQLPLYDAAETIARNSKLLEHPNAYLQYYMDVVLDFYETKGSHIAAFLEHLAKKKASLSVISPEGQDAVQIMTIHKSKGLEFAVVIFPYADLDIYREIEPKEWFHLDPKVYKDFPYTLLNFNSDFEFFGDQGLEIYKRHKSEQELDNINLLYVALTRAEAQLYIITKQDDDLKEDAKQKKYSGLLINYLKSIKEWDTAKHIYSFGSKEPSINAYMGKAGVNFQNTFISNPKEALNINIVTKSGMLWDTDQEEAIEKGNLVHNIMSNIKVKNDVEPVMQDMLTSGILTEAQYPYLLTLVSKVVNHPELESYFKEENEVYNERDIIHSNGVLVRPDRIVINPKTKTVTILDYKTGDHDAKYIEQLRTYEKAVEGIGYVTKKKILVYINNDVTVKNVN